MIYVNPYAVFFKIIHNYIYIYQGVDGRPRKNDNVACEDFSDEPWWALSHVAGRDPDRWKSKVRCPLQPIRSSGYHSIKPCVGSAQEALLWLRTFGEPIDNLL